MFATPDGRFVYVANQGTEDKPDNTVSVIDTGTNTVVATITVGKGAHGVVAGSDGKLIFVTDTFDDTVSVIDVASQKVVGTIPVGKAPNGITFKSIS
jgi:YVTN family beta-propeller protein